jgi:hypothetical protein
MIARNSTAVRGGRGLSLAAIAVSLLATGCTMCPDPFDYAGPVPNGAVSQNDFAARSNGILPVRATPLPWPPIVQASPQQPTLADEPTEGEPAMIAASPDLSPVVETEIVPVLGASLITPTELGDESIAEPEELPAEGLDTDDEANAAEPARVLWPTSSGQRTPGAATDGALGGPRYPSVLESRLPRDRPLVLLR